MQQYSGLPPQPSVSRSGLVSRIRLISLAGELGFVIALPLVMLVLVGIKLDRMLDTLPLFIIVAMIVSMGISGLIITRKIRRLQQDSRV